VATETKSGSQSGSGSSSGGSKASAQDKTDTALKNEREKLELGGAGVETAQVVSGSGQLTLILDGKPYNLSGLGGALSADLAKGLEYNANS
jgi:hypothetical protein